ATVNINDDGQGNSLGSTVVLNGDIAFDYDGVTSQTPVDANVNVNLDGKGSGFSGKIYVTGEGISAGFNEVKNMNISLSNDATWNLTGASVVNQATFGKDAVLILKEGSAFEATKDTEGNATTGGNYALNAGGGDANKLTIDSKAKLQITGIKETTYNIAQGFDSYDVADSLDIADNALLQANKKLTKENDINYYQVEVKTKEAEQMATEMGVSSSTAESIANVSKAAQAANVTGNPEGTGEAKAVALVEAMAKADSKVAGQAYEAVSKMAEAGGNSGTAASIVKNVTGVTNDRLSFNCGHSAPHKGGHGVGLLEEGSGADIWVEYVHGKDEVEDMPSTAGATSYEGKYNGIVMGVDFKKVNKFQSGIAFNYGEGDTNSVGTSARTRSDYDFWGIGYYGNIHNDDSNVIFDVSYAKTDSDVETDVLGINYKASPETTTWTAGVKVEKLYQNENVQIVPYTGLRFMSIDPEDYSTKCASTRYQMERQNVWLLPLGVSIRQEVTNDNGWIVSPRVDLSYIWAFGDTDSEMEFSTLGTKTNVGYEVMDDGSFLGLVGIEAHKGQWGYGVSYSYQKGDHSESKKWFIDANYSF
ncbi:MAG: autotransporter outer membrane beta-barrel domain-containing protein, partial [Phascolarctobacterium sp.]|nr:autotransporter outer membrane beta-barrel domain-containing protein [Phascolarctobacterium sp.]